MKKESKRGIIIGAAGIIIICILAFSFSFVLDTYTIPVANEASLGQVNGDDEAYLEMRTKKKIIETSQNLAWPVALVLNLGIIVVITIGTLKREGVIGKPIG